MLRVFEKYQKPFFFFIAILMIASFSFFGTFDTFLQWREEKHEDRILGEKVDGSPMGLAQVQQLSRFLSAPNLCDDGVIERDLLRTGIADLFVAAYFEPLQEELQMRLERARRYRPYAHPQVPQLNATLVWARFFPDLLREFSALREEKEATPQTFSHLSRLYRQQAYFPPELLRQCLAALGREQVDPNLSRVDLSLFGFHSLEDWFGRSFLDLAAEFILNTAAVAREKGFEVSLAEAKGDLLKQISGKQISFAQHLRRLGLDEKSACETWREVLLFRRYLGISEATFVDRLPYREFASYAKETAKIDRYVCSFGKDVSALQTYLRAISPDGALPPREQYLLEEVEKRFPELVQATYRAQIGEVSKKQVLARASVKEVWNWQLAHWDLMRQKFSFLPEESTREKRFAALEALEPSPRAEINRFTRLRLLDEHPEWVEQALAAAPLREKTFSKPPADEEMFYRIEELEQIAEAHLLTFEEAKEQGLLTEKMSTGLEKNGEKTLASYAASAYKALQADPLDPRLVKTEGGDPLVEQFKFERIEQEVQRMGKEEKVQEQAFAMEELQWSPIDLSEEGEISFFYLREKQIPNEPILEQIFFGKELLSSDAKRYLAEQILELIQKRNAISLGNDGPL